MNDRRRPKAPSETPAKKSARSLPPAPRSTLDVDLAALTAEQRELHLSGYASGFRAGLEAGRREGGFAAGFSAGWADRAAAEEAAWRKMADTIRRVTSLSPFSVLCERRTEGDTERADAARAFERRWGVAS